MKNCSYEAKRFLPPLWIQSEYVVETGVLLPAAGAIFQKNPARRRFLFTELKMLRGNNSDRLEVQQLVFVPPAVFRDRLPAAVVSKGSWGRIDGLKRRRLASLTKGNYSGFRLRVRMTIAIGL
jgi:hypothetical protein